MNKKWMSLLIASGLFLVACGNGQDQENNDKQNDKETTEQTTNGDTKEDANDDQNTEDQNDATEDNNEQGAGDAEDVEASPENALDIAQEKEEGELTEISFEEENGKYVYKVDLLDGQNEKQVKIDANEQNVIEVEDDTESDNDENTFKLTDAAVFDEVLKIAKDESDGELKEWTLNEDDGKLVYNIELEQDNQASTEFKIDAKTKEILEQDNED